MQRAHINILQVIVGVSCALFLFIFQTTAVYGASIGEYANEQPISVETFSSGTNSYGYFQGIVPEELITSKFFNLNICTTGTTFWNTGIAAVIDEDGNFLEYKTGIDIKRCMDYSSTTSNTQEYTNIEFDDPVTIGIYGDEDFAVLVFRAPAAVGNVITTSDWDSYDVGYAGVGCLGQAPFTCLLNTDNLNAEVGNKHIGWSAMQFETGDNNLTHTRIIEHEPNGTTTAPASIQNVYTRYYVNSSDEPLFGNTYIEMTVTAPDGTTETRRSIVPSYDQENTFWFTIAETDMATASGTFKITSSIYNELPSLRVLGWELDLLNINPSVIAYLNSYFWIGSWSDPASSNFQQNAFLENYEQTVGAIECDIDFTSVFSTEGWSCVFQKILAFIFPSGDIFADKIINLAQSIMSIKPIGYIYKPFEILLNPATSTPATLQLQLSNDMPISGTLITLDPMVGTNLLMTTMSSTTTILGTNRSYYEHMMFYWNSMWYLAFIFWFVFTILNLPRDWHGSQQQQDLNRTHTLDLRSDNKRNNTLDLRK